MTGVEIVRDGKRGKECVRKREMSMRKQNDIIKKIVQIKKSFASKAAKII